jgi:hypothetical protein
MAGAHEHPAFARDEREDVARTHEIGRADIAVGEIARRQRAVLGRDARRRAMLEIDGHREGRGMRRVVVGDHRVEVQPLGVLASHRRANDAGGVAHNEGHLLGRAMHGGDDQIALVLAAVIVHDDDDLATLEGADGFDGLLLVVRHGLDEP